MSSQSSQYSLPNPHRSPTRPALRRGIGIYVRKSTERRQGDLSLPAQERLIRAAIVEPSGQSVYRVYKDVLSGTRPDRQEYQAMLADARAGKLTMVVFHKVNRFGRNAAEGMAAIDELRELGVVVRVADMPGLDVATPEGMFVFTFLLGQGQYEVENLGNEAVKGMQQALLNGRWPFKAPFGYVNRRTEVTTHKFTSWIAVHRHQAAIVRLIFHWYATGTMTLASMTVRLQKLHEQRIAAGKSGCTGSAGKRWTPRMVWRILTNRFYFGEIAVPSWGIVCTGSHSPIIARDLFDRVQVTLRAHGTGQQQRHHYLLKGRVVCNGAVCSSTFVASKNRQYYYMKQDGRRRHFPAEPIESTVIERMRERVALVPKDDAAIIAMLRRSVAALQQAAHAHLNIVRQQRQRVLRLAAQGRFTDDEIAGELSRLDVDLIQAEHDVAQAEMIASLREQGITEVLERVNAVRAWDDLSKEVQCNTMVPLVDRVEIDQQGQVITIGWASFWEYVQ